MQHGNDRNVYSFILYVQLYLQHTNQCKTDLNVLTELTLLTHLQFLC